ncbi:50S ribosomal protein L30 [Halobacteriales archaeon QH_10_67_13]|nr:MAG: 50S ribosomal protein L30 [Halobacteriales archaeon QH_10_67_13]
MRALVQLRGEVNINQDVLDTLEMLNLGRVNHATFIPEEPTYKGMVTKVNDYVAHGRPSEATVAMLLKRRGETADGETVTDALVAEATDYADVDELAAALVAEETTLQDAGLSPTLRLHPPRGGHDGIKQPATTGGQLGVHEPEAIDDLLGAMR